MNFLLWIRCCISKTYTNSSLVSLPIFSLLLETLMHIAFHAGRMLLALQKKSYYIVQIFQLCSWTSNGLKLLHKIILLVYSRYHSKHVSFINLKLFATKIFLVEFLFNFHMFDAPSSFHVWLQSSIQLVLKMIKFICRKTCSVVCQRVH